MVTYKEIAYMCLDELKLYSDDSSFTIEHILFLADIFRALLLERKYKDLKKSEVNRSNYQEICFDLEKVNLLNSDCADTYLRSTEKFPSTLSIGNKHIYPVDYFSSENFTYIPMERMQYVGYNKWLKNIIYITKGPDDYLYLKSSNTQFLYLKQIKIDAVFQNSAEAKKLSCTSEESNCDILDKEFPLEEALISPLIQMVVQELNTPRYMPDDNVNNAKDDMSGMISSKNINKR